MKLKNSRNTERSKGSEIESLGKFALRIIPRISSFLFRKDIRSKKKIRPVLYIILREFFLVKTDEMTAVY
jgi:hypothetical protein